MRLYKVLSLVLVLIVSFSFSQDEQKQGKTNTNKFKQLYDEFATPNMFRTASGAPGPMYYQQQANYKMDIELDEENTRLFGFEAITYTNNSPDNLNYLWVQLDQNMRAKDSKRPLISTTAVRGAQGVSSFTNSFLKERFDGGFNVQEVNDANGNPLSILINFTMMRVELPKPLLSGETFTFSIKWWYNINNIVVDRGRSGYEEFEDGNRAFLIAQFYPRMAVYSDVEGWQHSQFWGRDEFALPFGDFEVNITVPEDHILEATGKLKNREKVFSNTMLNRFEKAKKSYDKPVYIVTEEEAVQNSKKTSKNK
ncbi:MAG: M1 family peptidase, partial [Bacteroidia bacterium]|nr:M1 family peptidase [Bacteroidia bacterium]